MPEWVVGIVGFALGVIFKEFVQAWFQRDKHRHERLMERYAELASVLAADVHRVKGLKYLLGSEPENVEAITEMEKRRSTILSDLGRLQFQIRVLETDSSTVDDLTALLSERTAVALPATYYRPGDPYFKFCDAVVAYEAACTRLMNTLAARHKNWAFTPPSA